MTDISQTTLKPLQIPNDVARMSEVMWRIQDSINVELDGSNSKSELESSQYDVAKTPRATRQIQDSVNAKPNQSDSSRSSMQVHLIHDKLKSNQFDSSEFNSSQPNTQSSSNPINKSLSSSNATRQLWWRLLEKGAALWWRKKKYIIWKS